MHFQEHDFIAQDFRFSSGATIPELRLHYRTLGTYSETASGSNAVLLLHGTVGGGRQFTEPRFADPLFGPGKPLDASRFFIIIPDAIGHEQSSKPSDGLGTRFPPYNYHDLVRGQHVVVTKALGVNRLRLVVGTSMSGMLTWLWGTLFPTLKDGLLPVASLPESVRGRNLLWRRMLIDAIRSDPEYREGRYETQPAALGAVWNLFNLMADSDFHLEKAIPNIASADQTVSQRRQTALTSEDANNLIYQFEASQDYDPEPALGNIRAAMIAVNFADDVLNPPELGTLARLISKVPRGRAVTIPVGPESHGHLTLQESALWGPQVTILFQSMDEA